MRFLMPAFSPRWEPPAESHEQTHRQTWRRQTWRQTVPTVSVSADSPDTRSTIEDGVGPFGRRAMVAVQRAAAGHMRVGSTGLTAGGSRGRLRWFRLAAPTPPTHQPLTLHKKPGWFCWFRSLLSAAICLPSAISH